MIYFIHGENIVAVKNKAHELIDSLFKKKPDASLIKLDNESKDFSLIDESIFGQGLFEKKYIVFFDNIFSSPDWREKIIDRIKEIAESNNIFIICEGKLDKKTASLIEKNAVKSQEYKTDNKGDKVLESSFGDNFNKKTEFNIFSLAEALGEKRFSDLWLGIKRANSFGIPAEQIQGILFWQIKSIIMSIKCSLPEECGLKPFVYSKAKNMSKRWNEKEIQNCLLDLLMIYHKSREEGGERMELGLEKWVVGRMG